MKFVIDVGHNSPPGDTGAVGILSEDKVVMSVGAKLANLLKNYGHQVIVTNIEADDVNESLRERCEQSNKFRPDYFISIHCNAFKPTKKPMGSEVFAMSKAGKALAKKALDGLTKLGFKNRGVKDGGHLFVLKNTDAPAILIELFFIDSEVDCSLYQSLGVDNIAKALAEELTK